MDGHPGEHLPISARVCLNGRMEQIFATAYADQVDIVLPDSTLLEFDLRAFRGFFIQLLIGAYTACDDQPS